MMVLPINWRSNLSFEDGMPPPVSKNANNNYKNNYSLADITLQTIPAVRNLIGDVMLDIPYYLSHHKKKMIKAVVDEANRVYGLWREYNPGWEERGGRVHLIAHSLGSAIALDVLSKQPTSIIEWRKLKDHKYEKEKSDGAEPKGCYGCTGRGKRDREEKEGKERDQAKKDNHDKSDTELLFDFDTSGLFCVGSPAGFFLLLNRSKSICTVAFTPTCNPYVTNRMAPLGMLIPRRGRRKPGYTKPEVEDPGVTGEAGTYGCLAVDNIYNVMNYSDRTSSDHPTSFLIGKRAY